MLKPAMLWELYILGAHTGGYSDSRGSRDYSIGSTQNFLSDTEQS